MRRFKIFKRCVHYWNNFQKEYKYEEFINDRLKKKQKETKFTELFSK